MKRSKIIIQLKKALDKQRFEHSLRVEKVAITLARQHGISIKATSQAALLHDYARKYSGQELIGQAKKFKIKISPLQEFAPKLLHAELSARLAKQEFGIKTKAILNAISKHTVGSPKMTTLEKIIYVADHIEEERSFPGINKLRRLAKKNLDQAVLESSTIMIRYLLAKGAPIFSGTISTRNYYLLKR